MITEILMPGWAKLQTPVQSELNTETLFRKKKENKQTNKQQQQNSTNYSNNNSSGNSNNTKICCEEGSECPCFQPISVSMVNHMYFKTFFYWKSHDFIF